MMIDLDYHIDGRDYEEVVTFRSHGHSINLAVWRTPGQITVQPLLGLPRQFFSISEATALASLTAAASGSRSAPVPP